MTKIPDLKPGDLVKVYSKIIEGDKERITPFQGVVIQIKGSDIHRTFTVRKISAGIGIEKIFPIHSPMITKIEIKKKGKVRRAKLSYLRQRRGRKMKIKEATPPSPAAKKQSAEPAEKRTDAESTAAQEPQPVAEKAEETTVAKDTKKKTEERTGEGAAG